MIGWQIYFWVMVVLNIIGIGVHIAKEGQPYPQFYSFWSKLAFILVYAPAFVILYKYINGLLVK